jgi:hypothetical protein
MKIKSLPLALSFLPTASGAQFLMAATGELIRLINYVDDINTTLRRIQASLHGIDAEERKRLVENLQGADTRIHELLEEVGKR